MKQDWQDHGAYESRPVDFANGKPVASRPGSACPALSGHLFFSARPGDREGLQHAAMDGRWDITKSMKLLIIISIIFFIFKLR
jgi:hypothetical protein